MFDKAANLVCLSITVCNTRRNGFRKFKAILP